MHSTRTRRTLGAGAATVVAALAVGTATLPAHAADHQLKIFVAGSYQLSSTPAPQPQWGENVFLNVGRTGTGPVDNVKLTLDVSGLDGVASLSTKGRCTTAGKIITCDVGRLDYEKINITDNLWLSALPGVKPGASGTVHATLSAPGAQTGTADFRVDVGAATFRTKAPSRNEGVKVGGKLPATLEFANHGDLPAKRAIVNVNLTPGLKVDTWPSNCEYAYDKGTAWGKDAPMPLTHAICTIDGEIAPGQAVKLDGLDITVGSEAFYDVAGYTVFPTEDAYANDGADLRKRLSFQHGTGKPATLVDTAGTGIPAGLDVNGYNTEQEVVSDNGADFEATSSWAPDASGTTGTFTVGMGNKGPGSIYDRSGGEGAPDVTVQFPEGVTVTGLPDTCKADDYVLGQKSDKPLNKFACDGIGSSFMPSGATVAHKLTLKLPEGTGELTGTVSLQNEQSSFEPGHPSAVMPWDHNPANDLVTVSLRGGASGTGGTPTPTPTGTPTETPTGTPTTPAPTMTPTVAPAGLHDSASPAPVVAYTGSGGSTTVQAAGGSLASTGSSAVLPMAATGAAAVVLGAAGLITARRLRARRDG
ncbi:hypothetical protein [Streptomyces sp. 1331.2]|uniref:hypothetical protein n=1 Tax=Streptomyces sp. 1331.2 TaxID=1938835 RepID=UPI000BCB4515|nr:hypothetical protein [Streptomyces sp. 1331.2]SOB83434.1 hypothetical protein SAMN06272789_3640 [Streptomyces sp. 1331.2]